MGMKTSLWVSQLIKANSNSLLSPEFWDQKSQRQLDGVELLIENLNFSYQCPSRYLLSSDTKKLRATP